MSLVTVWKVEPVARTKIERAPLLRSSGLGSSAEVVPLVPCTLHVCPWSKLMKKKKFCELSAWRFTKLDTSVPSRFWRAAPEPEKPPFHVALGLPVP